MRGRPSSRRPAAFVAAGGLVVLAAVAILLVADRSGDGAADPRPSAGGAVPASPLPAAAPASEPLAASKFEVAGPDGVPPGEALIVRVLDPERAPIAAATVFDGIMERTTAVDGTARIPIDTAEVRAAAPRRRPAHRTIVPEDRIGERVVTLVLEPGLRFTGYVHDAEDRPVPGVPLAIECGGVDLAAGDPPPGDWDWSAVAGDGTAKTYRRHVVTDATGRFFVDGLAAGRHRITPEDGMWIPARKGLVFSADVPRDDSHVFVVQPVWAAVVVLEAAEPGLRVAEDFVACQWRAPRAFEELRHAHRPVATAARRRLRRLLPGAAFTAWFALDRGSSEATDALATISTARGETAEVEPALLPLWRFQDADAARVTLSGLPPGTGRLEVKALKPVRLSAVTADWEWEIDRIPDRTDDTWTWDGLPSGSYKIDSSVWMDGGIKRVVITAGRTTSVDVGATEIPYQRVKLRIRDAAGRPTRAWFLHLRTDNSVTEYQGSDFTLNPVLDLGTGTLRLFGLDGTLIRESSLGGTQPGDPPIEFTATIR